MKIVFTICSNNYLAQARAFKKSCLKHNKDYIFYLGLVDRLKEGVDYSWIDKNNIIPVEEIGIVNFDGLWKTMDIVEFNTCVKPSYFRYFLNRLPTTEVIFYFDPDIFVYDSFADLEEEFKKHDILLTPHIVTPIPLDGIVPQENLFLNHGLYNLGFLGLKVNTVNSQKLLVWWEERCLKLGYNQPQNGLFVDQLWMNLVPLYFERVGILKRYGYNMGPWNLHERKVKVYKNEEVILNDDKSLVFYHFSSYSFKQPDILSKFYKRVVFTGNGELKNLYDAYRQRIEENNIDKYRAIPCYYVTEKQKLDSNRPVKEKLIRKTKDLIINLLPHFVINAYRKKN